MSTTNSSTSVGSSGSGSGPSLDDITAIDLFHATDWSLSSIGTPDTWPQNVKFACDIIFNTQYPAAVWVGPSMTLIYNEAWIQIIKLKHPWAMGQSAELVWAEIWDSVKPIFDETYFNGRSTYQENFKGLLERDGYTEEAYFNFTVAPIFDETGKVSAMINMAQGRCCSIFATWLILQK